MLELRIVFVAQRDSAHARALFATLLAAGMKPDLLVVASPAGELRRRAARAIDFLRKRGPIEMIDRIVTVAGSERMVGTDLSSTCSLREQATLASIPVIAVRDLMDPMTIAVIRERRPDLLVLGGAPIINAELIESARLGVVNAHIALAPEVRGMDAVEWSLIEGVPTGVTVMLVDEGIDTGPVLLRREVPAVPGDSLGSLRSRLEAEAQGMVVEAIRGLADGTLEPVPQATKKPGARRAISGRDSRRAGAQLRRIGSEGRPPR